MVEAPQIELADVERWIVRTAEVQPWDFLNAVSARDMRRSLELFNLLPAKSYVWTYTLLCGRIRELIVAKRSTLVDRVASSPRRSSFRPGRLRIT